MKLTIDRSFFGKDENNGPAGGSDNCLEITFKGFENNPGVLIDVDGGKLEISVMSRVERTKFTGVVSGTDEPDYTQKFAVKPDSRKSNEPLQISGD